MPTRILVLLLSLLIPVWGQISTPADSTIIDCSAGANRQTAIQNALTSNLRVILDPGAGGGCLIQDLELSDSDEIHGPGSALVTLTVSGGSGCVIEEPSNASGPQLSGFTLNMNGNTTRDGICMNGFSNTANIRDVKVIDGRNSVVFTRTTADNSCTWVSTLTDFTSVNPASNALQVASSCNIRMVLIRPNFSGSGGPAIQLNSPAWLNSNIEIIEGTFSTDTGVAEIINIAGGSNTPVTIVGGTVACNARQHFITTNTNETAVSLLGVSTSDSCDLLLNKPTAAADIADSASIQQVLPRASDARADVANMTAGDQTALDGWIAKIVAAADYDRHWYLDNLSTSANVACSGDIGSSVNSHLAAGRIVYIGNGQCSSSVPITGPSGSIVIGKGMGITEAGAGQGTYVIFTGSSASCGWNFSGNVEFRSMKWRANSTACNSFVGTGLSGLLEAIYSRTSRTHLRLIPDAGNVVADGLIVKDWLAIHPCNAVLDVQGTDSKMDLTVIAPDVGRGMGPHYIIHDIDGPTSSMMVVGGVNQLNNASGCSGSTDEVFDITSSENLPITVLGGQMWAFGSTDDFIVTDSSAQVLQVAGYLTFTNPSTPLACHLYVDKPGTGDDLACPSVSPSYLRSLWTSPLVAPPNEGSSTEPPTSTNTSPSTNQAPTATDMSISAVQGTPVGLTLKGSDPDGDSLTYKVVVLPQLGVLSGTAPNLTYLSNLSGSDSFVFEVNDGKGGTARGTVNITIQSSSPTTGGSTGGTTGGTPISGDYCGMANIRCAHLFSGSDAGKQIQAAINDLSGATGSSGGTVDARGVTNNVLSAVTVKPGIALLLPAMDFKQTGVLTVNEEASVLGRPNDGKLHTTRLSPTGIPTSIRVVHSLGATQHNWVHRGMIAHLRVQGDLLPTGGTCVEIYQPGENWFMGYVHLQSCKAAGITSGAGPTSYPDSWAGANKLGPLVIMGSECAVRFSNVAGEIRIEELSGDDNQKTICLKGSRSNGVSLFVENSETFSAGGNNPLIEIDDAGAVDNLTIIGGRHSCGAGACQDYIRLTNTLVGGGPHIALMGEYIAGYKNLVNDVANGVVIPIDEQDRLGKANQVIYSAVRGDLSVRSWVARGFLRPMTAVTSPGGCSVNAEGSLYFNTIDKRLCVCTDTGTGHRWYRSDNYGATCR